MNLCPDAELTVVYVGNTESTTNDGVLFALLGDQLFWFEMGHGILQKKIMGSVDLVVKMISFLPQASHAIYKKQPRNSDVEDHPRSRQGVVFFLC